jgi:glycosyltransferase involved in cell wall biosynthesis
MKKRKKLVLFFTLDVSLKTWKESGLFSREIRPYLWLAEQGWDVFFVTYGTKEDLSYQAELGPIQVLPLYKNFKPGNLVFRILLSPLCLWIYRRELRDAAIYKTNQFWGGWNAILAKWVFGGKSIARCGYEYLAFTIQQKHARWRIALAWLVDWFCYRFADLVVVATVDDEKFAKARFTFLRARKVEVQPNWIDTDVFQPMMPKTENRDLIYIGRLNAQKNLKSLIEAAAQTKVSLDIYGSGEEETALRELASSLAAQVLFKGPVANDEIPAILRDYKIFVLPSLFEGNPKALLEAMACGMAVIGADAPGINSLINHDETGRICTSVASSMAAEIRALLSDANLRRRLGNNARTYIEARNSYTTFTVNEERRLNSLAKGVL